MLFRSLQGVFAEGWSLPGEYLWHAEGALGLAVLLAVLAVLAGAAGREAPAPRARLWLGLAVLIYALLTACSTLLEKFVLYGRTVRPLAVCGCLLGGYALARLLRDRPRWPPVAVAVILALAAVNIVPHFRVVFPHEARLAVWSDYGVPKLAASFSGLSPDPTWPAVTRGDLALVNALNLQPLRAPVPDPAGRVLAEWRHPLSLPVYHYEGHTPRERRLLRAQPPAIRLIRLTRPAELPDIPPVEFFLTAAELADGYDRGRR